MRRITKGPGGTIVKHSKPATCEHSSSKQKVRIVLDGLRGEYRIAGLCRREGISQGSYYKRSKDFIQAGKHHLASNTTPAADEPADMAIRNRFFCLKSSAWDKSELIVNAIGGGVRIRKGRGIKCPNPAGNRVFVVSVTERRHIH